MVCNPEELLLALDQKGGKERTQRVSHRESHRMSHRESHKECHIETAAFRMAGSERQGLAVWTHLFPPSNFLSGVRLG